MGWKNILIKISSKFLRISTAQYSQQLITMVYTRFVEAGRVCLVSNGERSGSLVVICDVIDVNRVLVDNPVQNVPRQSMRLQDLNLTDLKVSIPHGARGGAVRRAYEKADIESLFANTAWSKKLAAKKRRQELTDFERFKVKIVKQQKTRLIKKAKKSLR